MPAIGILQKWSYNKPTYNGGEMNKDQNEKVRENTDKFSRSFSSESLLQQALAGLLTRMPDITGVQILQGAQEFGKDLIFFIPGGFGERILCACVVKNTRITGDAGKSEGARTILLQAQQAFDTPHTDGFGRDISVERVYVITPFELPPATVASIRGRLKERSGQIVFIGGPLLFDLFKQYWPDFLADEATAIDYHLRQIRQGLENESALSGLVLQHNLGRLNTTLKRFYVPQLFHRELFSYSLGSVLTDPLPMNLQICSYLLFDRLKEIIYCLKKFQRALEFLGEWKEHFDLEGSRIRMEMQDTLIKIISELDRQLEFNIRRKLERKEQGDFYVTLAKAPSLDKQLRWVIDQKDKAFSRLKASLVSLNKVVASHRLEGIQSLLNKAFLSACNTDNCARAASDGLFIRRNNLKVSFPKDILDKWKGPIMIVGAPGYGKTSFCRWNALRDAEEFNSGKSNTLPVYVPLHTLARGELKSFEEAFLQTLGKSALLVEARQENYSTTLTRIRLYLDGLDEVVSQARRREIVDLVRQGTDGTGKYQVVLTARDHVHGDWLNWLPRIYLGGFDDQAILEFVGRWLGDSSSEAKKFFAQLNSIPALTRLMHTPLLATLIILVFRQTGRLPENKTRLYEIFVELLSGGWDMAKGILRESMYGQRVKLMVLKTLAGKLHGSRRSTFGDDDIKEAIQAALPKSMLNEWESFQEELIED
jgi:hypothetical protein